MLKQTLLTLSAFFLLIGAQAQMDTVLILLANGGGANNEGTMLLYYPKNNDLQKLHDFNQSEGRYPWSAPLHASNGLLYGLVNSGGNNGTGVLFSYDFVSKQYDVLVDLDNTTGMLPLSAPVEYNGKLYGLLNSGGQYGYGTLTEFDISTNTATVLVHLDSVSTGGYPWGEMALVGNKLYGANNAGGQGGIGTIFEYDLSSGVYSVKAAFDTVGGGYSISGVMEASDGKMYGATTTGGIGNRGFLWVYDPSTESLSRLADIGSIGGIECFGGLTEAPDGFLYGTAVLGGQNNSGLLFRYDMANQTMTKVHDFSSSVTGRAPASQLITYPDGKLYGATVEGGADNVGVIFSFDPANDMVELKQSLQQSETGSVPKRSLSSAYTIYVGVDGLDKPATTFRVFPNPAGNSIQLDLTKLTGQQTIRLIGINGQLIQERRGVGGGIQIIALEHLLPGYYVVEVEGDYGAIDRQVIVKE